MQTLGNNETAKLFGESFPKNIIINPKGITSFYSEGGNENMYINIEAELKRLLNKDKE
ncbi:hypothetical protein [Flavobacterium daejeonense]|uniref:hypothetical protein n=1 Tax=Flavobacterium daejeonense TaxID=350893 RepID=UPI000AFAAD2C|nr:hypothetical protein [Flavobacterium daejeonense]